jgi:hypothetical protein
MFCSSSWSVVPSRLVVSGFLALPSPAPSHLSARPISCHFVVSSCHSFALAHYPHTRLCRSLFFSHVSAAGLVAALHFLFSTAGFSVRHRYMRIKPDACTLRFPPRFSVFSLPNHWDYRLWSCPRLYPRRKSDVASIEASRRRNTGLCTSSRWKFN